MDENTTLIRWISVNSTTGDNGRSESLDETAYMSRNKGNLGYPVHETDVSWLPSELIAQNVNPQWEPPPLRNTKVYAAFMQPSMTDTVNGNITWAQHRVGTGILDGRLRLGTVHIGAFHRATCEKTDATEHIGMITKQQSILSNLHDNYLIHRVKFRVLGRHYKQS